MRLAMCDPYHPLYLSHVVSVRWPCARLYLVRGKTPQMGGYPSDKAENISSMGEQLELEGLPARFR